jgi:hypothetical protein
MMEFVIFLIVLLDHENQRVGTRAIPTPSYEVCHQLAEQVETEAQLSSPGLEVRTACISSQSVKRLQ